MIAPFVTRPSETVYDRKALNLAPVLETSNGLYKLVEANGKSEATIVIQGSGVAYAFVEEALPLIRQAGMNLDVYYVSSAEIFDMLPIEKQREIFPETASKNAIGITGFTLPTMFRWIRSESGLDDHASIPKRTLFRKRRGPRSNAAGRSRWKEPVQTDSAIHQRKVTISNIA